MAFNSRSLTAALLAVSVAGCTEFGVKGPAPAKLAARVGISPEFTPAARAIAASLGDFGLAFDRVHVAIRHTPDTASIVLDTIVSFTPTSESLPLDLSVPVDSVGQLFSALIEYAGPNGVVFRGSKIVKSYAPGGQAPEEATLTLSFVGPGAKVKTLTLTPNPVSLVGSQTATLTVAATDSSGAATAVPPLLFSTSDAAVATVSSGGVVTGAGKRGTATITATTPTGITGQASASVAPPATGIVLVSGGAQSGVVGTQLEVPGVVRVIADDSLGVPNVPVMFAAPIGGGVGTASATTNAEGLASTTLTLATTAGPQSFSATAGNASVAIPATARPGAPSAANSTISASPTQITVGYQGTGSTVTVRSRDQYGNANTAGGATVKVTTNLGRFGLQDSLATVTATDAGNGTYTAVLFASNSGTATISGTLNGTAIGTNATVTVVAGAPYRLEVLRADGSGLAPSVSVGTPVAITVVAKDNLNNVATSFTGRPVLRIYNSTFGASDSVFTMPAAVAGVSTATVTFGQQSRSAIIYASWESGQTSLTGSSDSFAVNAGAFAAIVPAGFGRVVIDTMGAEGIKYPSIRTTDAGGNSVGNAQVNVVVSGPCTVNGEATTETVTTNADGVFQFSSQTLQIPYAGADYPFSCLIVASGSGGITPATLRWLYAPDPNYSSTWLGIADNLWNNPANWLAGKLPEDRSAFIPAFVDSKATLQSDALVDNLDVEERGTLDLNGKTLTATGNIGVRTLGAVTNGSVIGSGSPYGQNLFGTLPNFSCKPEAQYMVDANVRTTGDMSLGCTLSFGDAGVVTVGGGFSTTGSGRIAMSSRDNVLSVAGLTVFGGGENTLNAGTILIDGDFGQHTTPNAFAPNTGFVVGVGTSAQGNQSLRFANPGESYFGVLAVRVAGPKTISFESPIAVHDSMTVTGTVAGGKVVVNNGATVNGRVIFAGLPLTIDVGGPISSAGLTFAAGSDVTVTGAGNLSMPNGPITIGANARVTINATGTVTAGFCVKDPSATIQGSNADAVALLNLLCSPR